MLNSTTSLDALVACSTNQHILGSIINWISGSIIFRTANKRSISSANLSLHTLNLMARRALVKFFLDCSHNCYVINGRLILLTYTITSLEYPSRNLHRGTFAKRAFKSQKAISMAEIVEEAIPPRPT